MKNTREELMQADIPAGKNNILFGVCAVVLIVCVILQCKTDILDVMGVTPQEGVYLILTVNPPVLARAYRDGTFDRSRWYKKLPRIAKGVPVEGGILIVTRPKDDTTLEGRVFTNVEEIRQGNQNLWPMLF